MDFSPITMLTLALLGYVAGGVAGLLFCRWERLANFCAFGCATLAAGCGVVACAQLLASGGTNAPIQLQVLPALVPYVQFTAKLDSLSVFFGLIVSLVGFALSLYSLGYAREFFGRKNVGVLGAFFNLMLLATNLVFLSDNAFFFLIAWEIMALSAYCLVSFEDAQRRRFLLRHVAHRHGLHHARLFAAVPGRGPGRGRL
jgi:hydrogenase-4 component B